VRDFLVDNRIPVVSEDTWGGQITTAAVAHFAASTPEDYLINSTDLMNYNTRSTGIGGPEARGGRLYATDTPGLGVTPHFESLGAPVADYGAPK
jgi:L-alanine-DL-glutamate epimerase-like enolase superfamily enzyme